MVKAGVYLVVLLSYLCCYDGYKILVVFPIPTLSHGILGEGCVRLLLKAGHEVTYIAAMPLQDTHPNLTQININKKQESKILKNITNFINPHLNTHFNFDPFHTSLNSTKTVLENEEVKRLISDPKQIFDVLIIEWFFSEVLSGLSAVLHCPYIWLSSLNPHWMILELIDDVTSPAYVPSYNSLTAPPFTFQQRVTQLWYQIRVYYFKHFQYSIEEQKLYSLLIPFMSKRGRSTPISALEDMRYNASLILSNCDAAMLAQAISLPQNYKPVGGFHIEAQVKSLPNDLQKIMNNSKYGVIYFSIGSIVKSSELPDNVKRELMKTFSELNQTVIWKYEDNEINTLKNVHIRKWVPQQSVLSHPNCILFITHGGLLSITEAIYFGIPIIGIPLFSDQYQNVDKSVIKGFGKKVQLSSMIAHDLKIAINEVLNNASYLEKAKEQSRIYHDRIVSAGEELVHWVEHVVRTRGAPHLRSPAITLSFYQKLYLDLIGLVAVIFIIIAVIVLPVLHSYIANNKIVKTNTIKTKNKKNNKIVNSQSLKK
ncbi:UDP-glucosyltransferase 2-like [Galleria mellonella]|uniref:UDP-glucosyltransferase 2-like n=1 Tax=Galleria mellonella TaxID=7137 RepID=A0ABM3N0Y9_GALME|nr:UDP-glucosyltransferase 2-like [Galleria mellonella]